MITAGTGYDISNVTDIVEVVLGTTKIRDTTNNHVVRRALKYIFVHDGWSPTVRFDDIAVVRLAEKIEFTDYVKSINYATTSPAAGAPCVSSGWAIELDMDFSVYLQQVSITKYTNDICIEDEDVGEIGDGEFCGDSQSACKGEMGSPVVCDGVQAGIVIPVTCAVNNAPMIDVAYYSDWIETQQKRSGSNSLLNSIYLISFCIYICLHRYESL